MSNGTQPDVDLPLSNDDPAGVETASANIFSTGAIDDIYRFANGTAWLINKLCTHCLLYGAQNQHRIIDDHMVKRVIQGEVS